LKSPLEHLKGDGLRAQLLKGVGGSAGLQAFSMLLTLASGVLLARTLGPENYGVYTFIMSVMTLLSLPAKAGLPTLLIREIATNQLKIRWGLMRGLIHFSNGLAFTYSMVVVALATIWMLVVLSGDSHYDQTPFLWAFWLIPLMSLESVRSGSLRGLRWILSAQFPEKIIRPFVFVSLVGVSILLGHDFTTVNAIQFQLVGAFLAFTFGSVLFLKAFPREASKAKPEYTVRPWMASLLPLTLFVGLKLLDSQVSILFLGVWATTEEVALFRVAATGAGLVAFGLTAVNMALAPQVARLYQAGEIEKLQRVITLSTRAVAIISFPVALLFIVWGEPIVSFVFGDEYVKAAMALGILCVGQLVNASAGSVGLVLNMTGNDKLTFIAALLALLINSVLAIILIPMFGLIGAAISFSVSISVWNIFLVVATKWKVGINTFLFTW